MSVKKKKSYDVKAHQMGDILDEFNALKRMIGCLHQHGDCMIKDLNEAGYLIPHLAEVFNFRPQVDPDEDDGRSDSSRDFVFSTDPRAFTDDDDDSETNGDLH
jgi:hypothetical protein